MAEVRKEDEQYVRERAAGEVPLEQTSEIEIERHGDVVRQADTGIYAPHTPYAMGQGVSGETESTLLRRRPFAATTTTTTTTIPTPLTAPPAPSFVIEEPIYLRRKQEPWYRRHPLLTALLALSALGLLWYLASAPVTTVDENGELHNMPPGSKSGSWHIPFVGETLDFMRSPFTFGLQHAKEYGPVSYSNLLMQDTIVLSGRALGHFYNSSLVGRRGAYPVHVVDLMGGEVLPMLDEPLHSIRKEWLHKAFEPGFMEEHLYKIEDQVQESMNRWTSLHRFHWVPEFRRLTARITGSLLFSDPAAGEAHLQDFEDIHKAINSFPSSLPLSNYRNGEKARDNLFDWYIDHNSRLASGEKKGLEIGRLMLPEQLGQGISADGAMRELHHLGLSIYGIHHALAFTVQALSQHADVWRRAKAEVANISSKGQINLDQLRQLTYLGQIVNEVKRYYPLFAGAFGYAKQGFYIEDNYVPKDSILYGSLYAANHDPSLFTNPEVFDPSRFHSVAEAGTEGASAAGHFHPHHYSHGVGMDAALSHKCPGEDLSSYVMKIVLVHLLRGYSWDLPSQNMQPKWDLFLPVPRSGLMVHSFSHDDQPINADYIRA